MSAFPSDEITGPPPRGLLPELSALEDTGLPASLIEQILVRMLYARGEMSANELAAALGLRYSLISELIQSLKLINALQVKRTTGMGEISAILALTAAGKERAREYLEICHYSGAVPVPLDQYAAMVRKQRRPDGWVTREIVAAAYGHMVMSQATLDRIGPAVNSGRSFLIYGKPGNGKTYLAEALANLGNDTVWIPYAIEYQGNIVQVYDPALHHAVDDGGIATAVIDWHSDHRWVKCRRPFLTSGGELALEMLDLSYNSATRIYEAPMQLKANNGIYLIDDFGRQKVSPAEVLNRWIVPMERHVDYLTFLSGGKITVPFQSFLVFSTNLDPEQLGDEAFLRRIQYKMLVHNPNAGEFAAIFAKVCASHGLEYPPQTIERFIDRNYRQTGRALRRCHPRDVLSHAVDIIRFEKRLPVLDDDLLDRAFASCFVEEESSEPGMTV